MNVSFKPTPISDEEAWALTVAWAEVKAQERETKAVSQTDTDESYDSDDSEFGVPTHPVKKSALFACSDTDDEDTVEQLVRSIVAQWVTISKKWLAATIIQAAERGRAVRSGGADFLITTHYAYNEQWRRESWWVTTYTLTRATLAMTTLWNVEKQAATIIQAAERGRVVRMVMAIRAWATKVLRLSKFVAVDWEGIAVARAVLAMGVAGLMNTRAVVECDAATIIQAAARGRAVRLAAWDDGFAVLDGALLEGWEVRRSRRKRNGHVWYFHAATMKKTWTRPVAETDELLMRLRKERRRATKETRRAWKAAFDPITWYRV
jgi:hypothetical protein